MVRYQPENPKFGSKGNSFCAVVRKYPLKGQFRLVFKCGILITFVWLCGYTLVTSLKWKLVDEIRMDDEGVPLLQEEETTELVDEDLSYSGDDDTEGNGDYEVDDIKFKTQLDDNFYWD